MKPMDFLRKRWRFYTGLGFLMLVTGASVLLSVQLEDAEKLQRFQHNFGRFAQNRSVDRQSLLRQARKAIQKRQYEIAEKRIEEVLKAYPSDPDAWQLQGVFHYRQGAYPQAEQAFRYLLRQRPDSIGGRNNLAHTLWRQGRQDEAQKEIEKALQAAPEDVSILLTATIFAAERGQDGIAAAYLERALHAGASPQQIARDPRLEKFVGKLAESSSKDGTVPAETGHKIPAVDAGKTEQSDNAE